MFKRLREGRIISESFPQFTLNEEQLSCVSEHCYCYIFNNKLHDDCAIQRWNARTYLL